MRARFMLLPLLLAASAALRPAAQPEQGRQLFEKRCGACHSLEGFKEGPPLRGLFGRRSGSVAQFPYSASLRTSRFVWDRPRLDRWLTDPDSLVPNADMAFRLENADERAVILDYLEKQR